MSVLDELNWPNVRAQYEVRLTVHRTLGQLFSGIDRRAFFDLAMGITTAAGNYSAFEHGLGSKIRSANLNPEERVHLVAGRFRQLQSAREVPEIIRQAEIDYLSIGVGSELSCLMNPEICWIANTRSIWTHLVVKHNDNFVLANEELNLYRTQEGTSEMAYEAWSAIHAELDVALTRLSDDGSVRARRAGVAPGAIKYLWGDAIANAVYEAHSPRARHWRNY